MMNNCNVDYITFKEFLKNLGFTDKEIKQYEQEHIKKEKR